jgi:hypothetical protein
MGMPGLFYSLACRAHSLKSLERNILNLAGIEPVHHTVIGSVGSSPDHAAEWLERVRRLGRKGQ